MSISAGCSGKDDDGADVAIAAGQGGQQGGMVRISGGEGGDGPNPNAASGSVDHESGLGSESSGRVRVATSTASI